LAVSGADQEPEHHCLYQGSHPDAPFHSKQCRPRYQLSRPGNPPIIWRLDLLRVVLWETRKLAFIALHYPARSSALGTNWRTLGNSGVACSLGPSVRPVSPPRLHPPALPRPSPGTAGTRRGHPSCLVPRASCLVPRASCLVPRASCLVPPAAQRPARLEIEQSAFILGPPRTVRSSCQVSLSPP
jgi:hypothetical protein